MVEGRSRLTAVSCGFLQLHVMGYTPPPLPIPCPLLLWGELRKGQGPNVGITPCLEPLLPLS